MSLPRSICVFLSVMAAYCPLATAKDSTMTVYVTRASDRDYQRVSRVTVDRRTLAVLSRTDTPLGCDRVHAAFDGTVLCFTRSTPNQPKYYSAPTAYVWKNPIDQHSPQKLYQIKGRVSRARISSDSQYVGTTVFTTGHSYLGVGGSSFSTTAQIGRTEQPSRQEDLQNWNITQQNGELVRAVDLNLWGVTFHPRVNTKFLVTVYYNGVPHMGEGDIQSRSIRVLAKGVECPSYSPEGERIAYKKRVGPTQWSPAVMDLTSMQSVVYTNVSKSVDDQIEWLDSNTLVFEVTNTPLIGKPRTDLATLDVREPSNSEKLWLEDAKSPAPLRLLQ